MSRKFNTADLEILTSDIDETVMNKNVAIAWIENDRVKNKNSTFWTDGIFIYSYNLIIGYNVLRNNNKRLIVVFDYTGNNLLSRTTAHHVNMAIRAMNYFKGNDDVLCEVVEPTIR